MVSNVPFPSFKKRSHHPHASRYFTLAFLFLLSLLIVFREKFFLWFFLAYVLVTLGMNLGWLLGWRGVDPPAHRTPREDSEA